STIFTQEEIVKPQTVLEKMEEDITTTKAQWRYNPFRKSDTERKLIGWLDPNNFVSQLWVGDVLSKYNNFPDPHWNLDKAYIFYGMKIATEVNPIAFTVNNFTFRLGVAYFVDLQLLGYSEGFTHKYGGDIIISDYMRINFHFDFLIGDRFKFRWTPLYHECAHVSGDYQGDPDFDPETKSAIPDLGLEGMKFEAYYNYGYFTFYGGINFTYNGGGTYKTLIGMNFGTDVRIPVWGEINFIMGFHVGANYDRLWIIDAGTETDTPNTSDTYITRWYPTIVTGIGFEIDRFIIGAKYSRMRSRHMISYTTIDERIGIDISILF
ncbi:MAG: hypothetical protein ACRCWI_03390, partial [Brevinema sp.]